MRREPTLAEMRMWKLLKQCFRESRFRRQIPLGHFIVDFASHGASLVIEIDGGQHDPEVDAARSRVIEAEGYSIIRFSNNEVLENGEGCMIRLGHFLRQHHPHPAATRQQAAKSSHPSPHQGGGGLTREAVLIASLRALATHPAARGLNDDCAVLEFGGEALVLTHDMMVEGVHFLPGQDPADIAWKLVATNMSDLATKGAEPVGVLLGYMLGVDDARFIAGLGEALAHYGAPLLGGDTVSGTGSQALGLTAIGRATHRPVPSRSGAIIGEALWITGPVGAAMIGYEAMRAGSGEALAYRRPVALLAEGQALAPLVGAMMDVSDGVLLDARRMALASGVTIALDSLAVPLACPESRRHDALRWGDDYQLLFTAPADIDLPVRATRIGMVFARGEHPLLVDGLPPPEGEALGFEHN